MIFKKKEPVPLEQIYPKMEAEHEQIRQEVVETRKLLLEKLNELSEKFDFHLEPKKK